MEKKLTAVEKTIKIIKSLSEQPFEFSALELSKKLGFNRTTIHRILNSLEEETFVLRNKMNKKYYIGPALYQIGMQYVNMQNKFIDIRCIIDEVAKKTKQSVGYSIIEHDKIISLYESEISQPIKIRYQHGKYYPINCGGYGKTIMAFYEPIEELEKIVYSTKLEKRTYNTIVEPDKLLKEYEKIRRNGYAISDEENLLGALGIGAPIFNSKGKIHGALAVAAVKGTLNSDEVDELIKDVIEGAKEISKYVL